MGRPHRSIFAIALGALTAAAWACSSFDDADDTPAVEAGASDASPADSNVAEDANAKTDADNPDAAVPPFCKTNGAAVCEDFDDDGGATLPLTNVHDGGSAVEVVDPHVSPPRALRTTFARPSDAGACRYATRGTQQLALAAPNGFVAEYKIRPATVPGPIFAGADVTYESAAMTRCAYYFEVQPTQSFLVVETLNDPAPAQYISLSRKILPGEWSSVSWDIHGPAGDRKVTVVINGQAAATDQPIDPKCAGGIRIADVGIGLTCVTYVVGGDLDVAFDDLRVNPH